MPHMETNNRQLRAAWQSWAQHYNRQRREALRNATPVKHDDGCERTIEKLYLRADREYGSWVQVSGRKWTRQHHPAQPMVLRCSPRCGWESPPITNAEMLALLARAFDDGRSAIYTSLDL